ncbi:hypothetical protein Tco_1544615 [Tanacetum coccineum]
MNGLKITNLTQETLLGPAIKLLKGTRTNFDELEYDFKECYKALSKKLDWDNPEGGDYPFDLTKPLPLVMNGIIKWYQLTTSSTTISSIYKEEFRPWPIRLLQQRQRPLSMTFKALKTWFQTYGVLHDVYSTKRILAVTRVEVMRKHGYGYLREIEVRKDDNELYTFKEGDFLRLRINDIEDMLILVVENRLTNLSGDDVSDFAITLRMFTRSMVIQKRVKDLQVGVESY